MLALVLREVEEEEEGETQSNDKIVNRVGKFEAKNIFVDDIPPSSTYLMFKVCKLLLLLLQLVKNQLILFQ